MKLRLAGIAAIAALSSSLLPAGAATLVTIPDAAGDATAINDQGLCFQPPACLPNDTAAPWSQAGFDIISVTFASTFAGKAAKDLVISLEYAGPPSETSAVHRVTAEDAGGCTTFLLQYYSDPEGKSSSLRTCSDGADPTELNFDAPVPLPKVEGNKLVWTIPYALLKALPSPLKPGATLSGLGAHNRVSIPAVATVPQVDSVTSELSYKLGS